MEKVAGRFLCTRASKGNRSAEADGRPARLLLNKEGETYGKKRLLCCSQDVPYTTAILGGEVEFETLYGSVRCKVPAGSQAGSKLRLRNKGIVSMRDKNRYGDEYVILKISVPKQVSAQERELLQKLKNIEEQKPA